MILEQRTARGQLHAVPILCHSLGAEIGASIGIGLEGEVYAPLHDHNGNLVAFVNKGGIVTETYSTLGEQVIYNEELEPVSDGSTGVLHAVDSNQTD